MVYVEFISAKLRELIDKENLKIDSKKLNELKCEFYEEIDNLSVEFQNQYIIEKTKKKKEVSIDDLDLIRRAFAYIKTNL